jgi:hypothetical protein
MPLSELKGNQVIRTILEMSDELRPVLDKIGIGPNSKKEQLEELEEDPIFKSLRSMSAKMKRSAFGSDHGDDEPGARKQGAKKKKKRLVSTKQQREWGMSRDTRPTW